MITGRWLPRTSLRRITTLALAALLAAPLGGCEDDRGNPLGPGGSVLPPEILFGSALVSAELYRMINQFAETTLFLDENEIPLPFTVPSCQGDGFARITNNSDSDPATFAVTFTAYVIDCGGEFPLTISTDPGVDGRMILTFLETSPGLIYEVNMPMVGFDPRGINVQLPAEEGGFILETTTPAGPILYQLEGSRDQGTIHLSGTVRLEDRAGELLLVEELALTYAYDDDLIPKYADWPAGSYEIAGLGGGGAGFGGPSPTFPAQVFFDGLGGAAFPAGDQTCIGDLVNVENPCENF